MSEYNFISWHFIGVLVLRYSAEQSTIFIVVDLKLNLELLLSCVTLIERITMDIEIKTKL